MPNSLVPHEATRSQSVLGPTVRSWRMMWLVFNVILAAVISGAAIRNGRIQMTGVEFLRFSGWGWLLANGTFLIGPALDSLITGGRPDGFGVRILLFLVVALLSVFLMICRLRMFELITVISDL
jgi:hypothetical protein